MTNEEITDLLKEFDIDIVVHISVVIDRMRETLSDPQRLTVFHYFCTYCGSNNPYCQCWNDE